MSEFRFEVGDRVDIQGGWGRMGVSGAVVERRSAEGPEYRVAWDDGKFPGLFYASWQLVRAE